MLNVSQAFKDAISAQSRKISGLVMFEILDVTANTDATPTVTSESSFSLKSQLYNQNRLMTGKYATFELDYWNLDGSFVIPPKNTEIGLEVGWWSNILCGPDRVFSTPQVITSQFSVNHSSIGITVTFDPLTNEYATDFTIQIYNSSNALIDSISVTGNTFSIYTWYQNLNNYRKVVVTITKWVTGIRRARVTEIDFGIIETYKDDKIIAVNILEDIDTISNVTTTNELKFIIENQDGRFNIINPTGIYPYLQRKQKIRIYIGVEKTTDNFEFVPMGVYYLIDWKADDDNVSVTFQARDMMDILGQGVYRKGVYQTRSLYNLAVDVLTDAGVSDYYIDPALSAISVTGIIPIVTHREALQMIAIAGMAIVDCDRYGKVVLKQLSNIPLSESITFENMFRPPNISLDKLINTVDVVVKGYVAQASAKQIHNSTVSINGTTTVWIEYSSKPAQNVSASVTGGTLNSATYYGNAALLTITASGNVTITATGTVLDISESIYTYRDLAAPSTEQTLSVKIPNYLISSNAIAANVAVWVLNEYKKRFLYEVPWRMNPALECGDIVTVQDQYGENKTMRITKQEFNYTGGLSGKSSGKGAGT